METSANFGGVLANLSGKSRSRKTASADDTAISWPRAVCGYCLSEGVTRRGIALVVCECRLYIHNDTAQIAIAFEFLVNRTRSSGGLVCKLCANNFANKLWLEENRERYARVDPAVIIHLTSMWNELALSLVERVVHKFQTQCQTQLVFNWLRVCEIAFRV